MSGETEAVQAGAAGVGNPPRLPLGLSGVLIDVASELEWMLYEHGDEFLRGVGRRGIASMEVCRHCAMLLVRAALWLRVREKAGGERDQAGQLVILLDELKAEAMGALAEGEQRFPWWLLGWLAGGLIIEDPDFEPAEAEHRDLGSVDSWVAVARDKAFPITSDLASEPPSGVPRTLFRQTANLIDVVMLLTEGQDPQLCADLTKPLARLREALGSGADRKQRDSQREESKEGE